MEQKYKRSRFNYVRKKQDEYLLYNTLYNSLTRLSPREYEDYESEGPIPQDLRVQLVSQGILVPEDVDELAQYHLYAWYVNDCFIHKPHFTITPTMACNAKCFYCYEEGVRCGKMEKEDCAHIIDFIQTFDCSNGIDLTWFGGEPLLNVEWIDHLSVKIKEAGIDFSAFLITNGSKIDDIIMEKMVGSWNVRSVQITLDGSCEEYAARKSYTDQGEGIYYKILRSIERLSRKGIRIQIRLNIDQNNRESILEAVQDIGDLFQKNDRVQCYPAFLTGVEDPLGEEERVEFIKKMIDCSQGTFRVNEYLYRSPRTIACYHYQEGAYSIDVQGNVYTCEHQLGRESLAIGTVRTGILRSPREFSGKRPECQCCLFLPKCHGGCYDAYKQGDSPCFTDKYVIKAYLELL